MGHRRGVLACACAIVVASSLALSVAIGTSVMAQHAAVPALAGHDVLTVDASDGRPGGLYLVSHGSRSAQSSEDSSSAASEATRKAASATVATVQAGARSLPIAVRVTYSLDGPDVSRDAVAGASGLVGVHVTLDATRERTTRAAQSQRMLVMFTVPTRVAGDVSVGDDAIVTTHGSDTVVARVMRVGDRLDCYMTAKRFTMGDVIAVSADGASALAADAVAMGDGTLGASGGAGDGAGDGANASGAGAAGAHQRLIDELTTLRDLERSLAAREIAAKQDDYDKAFNAYMTAYVTSYTNHLSGSIGTSTQLTALMGTAGELGGDTPLAAAVLDEANATDALASAHQHAGAADALEQVIRMVRAQGTDGLADTLRRLAGEETTAGAEAYADGQTQLSQAMIPYSMAYTDAYTKHLSELTGGSSAGAAGHVAEANAATAREFGIGGAGDGDGDGGGSGADAGSAADAGSGAHAGDAAKVNAAMAALAAARERTGAGSAYRQVLLRFASELDGAGDGVSGSAGGSAAGVGNGASGAGDAASGSGNAGDGSGASGATMAASGRFIGRGMASDTSLSARAESTRLKQVAAAERKAAQTSGGDVTTTVIDENAGKMDAGDVMKFAGGVPGATGGKSGAAGDTGGTGATDTRGKTTGGVNGSIPGGSNGGASGGVSGDASAESGDADGADSASSVLMEVSPFVGMNGAAGGTGAGGAGTRLTADTTQLIADTTAFGDAGALIGALLADETVKPILSASSAQQDATRFLIINPGI